MRCDIFFVERKKGWIRIVEAFIAILLVSGVLIFVIDRGYIGKKNISSQVYDAQLAVLKEIQADDELRLLILNMDLPDEGNTEIPSKVLIKIESRIPEYLECSAKVCKLDKICTLDSYPDKDIYSKPIAIAAVGEIYNPRQLKLFCWVR